MDNKDYIPEYVDRDGYFVKLRDLWYKTVKIAGFLDIEKLNENRYEVFPLLKQTQTQDRISYARALENGKAIYFVMAGRWAHIGKFNKMGITAKQAKKLWKMHSEGVSVNKIVGSDKSIKLSYSQVKRLLNKMRSKMLSTPEPKDPVPDLCKDKLDILEIFAEAQGHYHKNNE